MTNPFAQYVDQKEDVNPFAQFVEQKEDVNPFAQFVNAKPEPEPEAAKPKPEPVVVTPTPTPEPIPAPVVEETKPTPVTATPAPVAPAPTPEPIAVAEKPKQSMFMAVPDNPNQYIPQSVKGMQSGIIGLGAMWEGVNIGIDASALNIAAKQLSNFDQIDAGTLKDPKQFLGKPSSQTWIDNAQYMNGDEATRAGIREKYAGVIGQREKVIQSSLATIAEYKEFAKQHQGKVEDLTSVRGVQDFTDWLKFTMGSAGVQLVPIILAAVATGGVGAGAVGMTMAAGEQFGNRIEYVLNQKAVKTLSPEEQAGKVERYIQDTMGVSMSVAAANGLLDTIAGPVGAILRSKFAKEAAKASGKALTAEAATKQAVKEIPRSFLEESLTGFSQEALSIIGERYLGEQTSIDPKTGEVVELDWKDPKNLKRLINAMASEGVGGLLGGGFNVGAAARRLRSASQETQDQLDELGKSLLSRIKNGKFNEKGIDEEARNILLGNAPKSIADLVGPALSTTTTEQQVDTTPSDQEAPLNKQQEAIKQAYAAQAPAPEQTAPEQTAPNLNSPVVATTRTEVGGKESIKTTRADGSVDIDGVLVTPATKQTEPPEKETPPEEPAAKPVNYIDTETGEIIPSDQADPQVQYINQETGEVIPPTRVEPVMEGGGNDAVIQRRADELSSDLGLPKNIALSVAQREAAERGQNVERTPAKSVTGRIEPSLSVSEQGTATTEGVAPSDTTGLAGPVEDIEPSVAGEGTEPVALTDVPTLTERPPAATYTQLDPDDKAGVLQEAQSMWESGEANLPMAKAWNSLPSWKRDMFAQEVYANYDEMTNNGEVFRAAMDKVIEAKKPEEVKAAAAPAALTAPVQLKLAEAETAVAEAVTPEEKKEATQQRNVARQEVKQAQAAAPVVVETPVVETPATKIWQPIASARLINAPFGVADVNGVHYEFGQYGGQKYEVDISTEEIGKNGVVRDNGDRRSNIMYPGGPVLPFVPPNVAPLLTKLSQTKVGDIATRDALMAQISEEFNKEVGQPVPAPATETPKTQAEINQERQAAQKAAATVETPAVETSAQVTGFKTSKGSEYVVDESGKTSRTKKSPGEGQGQTYAPHNAVYVDTAAQNAILEDMQGLFGVGGSIRIGYVANNSFNTISDLSQLPNNVEPVVAVINKQTGQAVAVHKASTEPKVGLHPVEKLYNDDGTSSTHLGNDITEITKSPAATTTEAAKRGRGRPPKAKVEGAEPTAPKPRGRRKIERTPEEQIVYEEGRNKIRAEINKARRAVEGAIAKLEEKVDVDRFDTPAALETATDILRQERNQAVYLLSAIAINPMFRKVESSGVKAIQFLESDSVTAQERLVAAQRLKFEDARNNRKAQAQAAPDSRFAKLGPSGISTKTNRGLYRFSNAADAAAYIAKSGTVFERALARRLMPFLTGVNLVIADTEENTIESAKEVLGKDSAAYFADDFLGEPYKMIVLRGENYGGTAAHGVNNVTFLHEALHAALAAKIDQAMRLVKDGRVKEVPANLRALVNDLYGIMNRAQDNYDALKASGEPISEQLQSLFEGIKIGTNIDEFLSYGMTDAELQKFLLGTPALDARDRSIIDRVKNLFTKFVETLRRAFDLGANHQSAFQDLIFATEGLLIEEQYAPAEVEKLRLAATNANAATTRADRSMQKIAASDNQQDIVDGIKSSMSTRNFSAYEVLMEARLPAMGNKFVTKSLFNLPTSDIIRWKGDVIPALKGVDVLLQRMSGSRVSMEKAFAKKADKLAKFIRYAKRSSRKALSTAMHLARLENVSPTEFANRQDALTNDRRVTELTTLLNDPRTNPSELNAITGKKQAREASINKVFDAWERLGNIEDGQDMYRMVRTFYKDMNVLHRTLLDARIDRLNLSGAVNDPTTPKGKLMMSVRRMFEGSDFAGIDEYFPFMRHGEYWLRVNGPEGREFYMFDNGSKRNIFLLERAAQIGINPKDPDAFDAGDSTRELRDKYSGESKILGEMFDVINQHFANTNIPNAANMSATELAAAQQTQAAALEQLKDSLYQTYLMTMPEQSYRKQFLHSENVTGFSADVLRNFKVSATKMASQAAKLAYGDLVNAEVQRGYDTLEGVPAIERSKLRLFVDEINVRAQEELNPPAQNSVVAGLNATAFFWLLSSVSSAITQLTSLPREVMPILFVDYGYGKATAKLTKYMQLWKSVGVTEDGPNGDTNWFGPSVGTSKMVRDNPLLRRAFDEATERGITAQTEVSVLTNRDRTPANAYANIPGAFLRATKIGMSALFSGAERMTREMTYMMTFELEYAKTGDFDRSVEKAIGMVQEQLGRYDSFNRPRILRNVAGRTVGQFKMYAINKWSFFIRNGYTIFSKMFSDPKLALDAMHRLGGVFTMAVLFGGVTALPLYSVICGMLDLYLNNFGDDEERKRRIARNPYTAESSDLRFRYEFLPEWFGPLRYQTTTGLDGKEHPLSSILERGAVSELTDINVGSRTSYDGMVWRSGKRGDTIPETVNNFVLANLGPAFSTLSQGPESAEDYKKGNTKRSAEKLAPAMFKGSLTAERLSSEGAKTPSGKLIMSKEEFSSFNLAMQSLGFSSTALSRLQENGIKLQEEIISGTEQRANILKRLSTSMLSDSATDADIEQVFNKIDKHNDRYVALKHLRIDPKDIKEVVDRAKDKEKFMFRGLYIRKEDLPYLLELRDVAEPPQKKK